MRAVAAAALGVVWTLTPIGPSPEAEEEPVDVDPEEPGPGDDWSPETFVRTVLVALGEPGVTLVVPDSDSARRGREIVETGRTVGPDGSETSLQSREFVCTHCHVTSPEDSTLGDFDPDARLARAIAEDLPLLPGTTLYGVVDRGAWFNGDWALRYGELVEPARRDLRAATELCWVECSQGRAPEPWELDAVLAHLDQLSLRLRDLGSEAPTLEELQAAARSGDSEVVRRRLVEGSSGGSPATFGVPPKKHGRKGGYPGLVGDAARGGEVYARGCLHCHAKGGPGRHRLAETKMKYRELLMNMPRREHESFYEVIRLGTKPHDGAYMPQFTMERMSDQQIEDLRAYLEASVRR
jgi:mono/diheme cytochrome c family protein